MKCVDVMCTTFTTGNKIPSTVWKTIKHHSTASIWKTVSEQARDSDSSSCLVHNSHGVHNIRRRTTSINCNTANEIRALLGTLLLQFWSHWLSLGNHQLKIYIRGSIRTRSLMVWLIGKTNANASKQTSRLVRSLSL